MKPFCCDLLPLSLSQFDMGGVLYHARYFYLYEQIREAWLRDSGVFYEDLVKEGYHLVIRKTAQRFLSPIYYGDKITSTMSCLKSGRASVDLYYELCVRDVVVNVAITSHVCVRKENDRLKIIPFPDRLTVAINVLNSNSSVVKDKIFFC